MSLLIKIMLVQLLLLLVLVIASCRAWTLPSSSTTTSAAASTKNNNVRIRQNHHVFNTIRVNKNINRSSVIKKKSSTQQSMTTVLLNEEYSSMMMMTQQDFSPFLVTALAIFLGVSAQTFINQMLEGDQGLGAFLKDGSGYNKSGFRQSSSSSSPGATASTTNNNKPEDPLPWLKLPKLDFVEVAGQESKQEEMAYQRLEQMRVEMNQKVQEGNVDDAARIREELEFLMKEAGIEYNVD